MDDSTRIPEEDHAVDDFPYKRLVPAMKDDIARRYLALIGYRPVFHAMRYRINNAPEMRDQHLRFCQPNRGRSRQACGPLIMVLRAEDYHEFNLISDYFIEQHRIRAYRGDDPSRESVYDYWLAHRAEILARTHDPHEAREIIYASKMEVGTFRPTVAAGLVWFLREHLRTQCDWVLNPCAGWGDRLLGLMAAGVRGSVDIDPNVDLGAEYPRMRAFAEQLAPTNFQNKYFPFPFEDIPSSDLLGALAQMRGPSSAESGGFDLAIMAPPYFDLEVYVPNDTAGMQSISRYTTFEEWFEKFLIVCIKKAGSLLRIGGILALIINQSPSARTNPGDRFLQRMVSEATRPTPGGVHLRYLGVISYAEKKHAPEGHVRSPQPIWLWMRE